MDAHVLKPVTETVRKGADKAAETASEAASASMRSLSGLADHDLVPLGALPSPRGRRRRTRSNRSRVILVVAALGAVALVVWKLRGSSPREVGRPDERASDESAAAEHGIVDQQDATLHQMGSNGRDRRAAKAASDA